MEDHAQDWKTEQSQSLAGCQTQPTSAPKASPLLMLSWFPPVPYFKWLWPAYPCCFFCNPLPPQLLPYMLPNLVNVIPCHCCLLCSVPREGSHWRRSPSPKISMQAHGSGRRLHSLCRGILRIHMEGQGGLKTAIPPNIPWTYDNSGPDWKYLLSLLLCCRARLPVDGSERMHLSI